MVIVQVTGGLGNQMFQYAAGRSLSARLGCDLFVDRSAYGITRMHNGFELERIFDCPIQYAAPDLVRRLLGWQRQAFAQKVLRRAFAAILRKRSLVIEPQFHYWEGFERIDPPAYLVGVWQTEKYFETISNDIREVFSFPLPLGEENEKIAGLMAETESVALHVRRGDYVTNGKASAYHGSCSLAYYERAIRYFCNRYDHPYFFVFSDDMAWVRQYLDIGERVVYVERNMGDESYKDMQLISLCKHQIVANSSFSWWGAWLNMNPRKEVVAPMRWFAANIDDSDMIPSSWIRL